MSSANRSASRTASAAILQGSLRAAPPRLLRGQHFLGRNHFAVPATVKFCSPERQASAEFGGIQDSAPERWQTQINDYAVVTETKREGIQATLVDLIVKKRPARHATDPLSSSPRFPPICPPGGSSVWPRNSRRCQWAAANSATHPSSSQFAPVRRRTPTLPNFLSSGLRRGRQLSPRCAQQGDRRMSLSRRPILF